MNLDLGDTIAALATAAGAGGRAVVRLEVLDPAGQRQPAYSSNLVLGPGRTTRAIPFAVNDTPGRWTIRATLVQGGAAAEAVIVLGPAAR